MKVGVCEVEWEEEVGKGGEEEAAAREGCGAGEGGGDGKVFIARGAGRPDCSATEMLSAAWLPPKDSASFPPNPPPPSVHLAPVSPLSALPPLFPSLPSLLLLYLLSFTLQLLLLGLFFFLHFSHFLSFSPAPPPTPLHVWAITDTQQWAEEGWGWLWRLDGEIEGGTKGLRCSGPTRVAGFEKKPGSFLMQRVDGQTRADRQSGLSPLFPSFSWCLFSAKKAHHLLCGLPSAPDVLSNTLRWDGGIGGREEETRVI